MQIDDPLRGADILGSPGSQDVADQEVRDAVDTVAFSDSAFAKPELLYGREGWGQMLMEDPEGILARAKFDYDWNFGLTPKQRAEAAWKNGFIDAGHDLLRLTDEETYAATKVADAVHLEAVRRRRMGGV